MLEDAAHDAVFIERALTLLRARGLKAVLFANPAPIARRFMPLDNVLSIARSRLAATRYREMLVQAGLTGLAFRKAARGSKLEQVGKGLRAMMPWLESEKKVAPDA